MDQMGYSSVVLYKMASLTALFSIVCLTVQDGGKRHAHLSSSKSSVELSITILRLTSNSEDVPRSACIKLQAVHVFGFTIPSAGFLFSIYQLELLYFTHKIHHNLVLPCVLSQIC